MIKTENGRPSTLVYIDYRGDNFGQAIDSLNKKMQQEINLPAGYSLNFTGKYEYMERVEERLIYILPMTLVIIFILLFMSFRNSIEPFLVILSVPFALAGGMWLLYLYQIHLSVAVVIGFIALAGVATEFNVVMLIYLKESVERSQPKTMNELRQAVLDGALRRVRPKSMTVAIIIGGLLPILLGTGAGLEIMRPVAVPMVGGMFTAPLVSMFLLPAIYYLYRKHLLTAEK